MVLKTKKKSYEKHKHYKKKIVNLEAKRTQR